MEPGVQSKFRMTERRNVIYRKYLQSVFCIALVLTVLTGCGKNTGQTSRSTEKKEIDIPIILTVDPTSGKKTEQDVVDAFNEEYAGTYHMQVEWIMETEEEYRKNLKRLNVTDELPAVIYDVRTLPSLHWWSFLAWFDAIGEGSFATVVAIRDKLRRGKRLENWELDFYRTHRAAVELRSPASPAQEAEKQRLLALLQ